MRSPLDLARIDGTRTLARLAEDSFDDPRLRQLVGRYATYSGSSPYRAPATLACIAHVLCNVDGVAGCQQHRAFCADGGGGGNHRRAIRGMAQHDLAATFFARAAQFRPAIRIRRRSIGGRSGFVRVKLLRRWESVVISMISVVGRPTSSAS